MADQPFDRATIGVREKPISTDHNREFSQSDRSIRDVLMHLLAPRAGASVSSESPETCFIGDGFRVVPSSPNALTVQVTSGLGFVVDGSDLPTNIGDPDIEGISDLSMFKPVVLAGVVTFTVPAVPSSPNVRTDIIEVRTNRFLTDADTRLQLDPSTKTFGPKSYNKTLSFAMDASVGTVVAGGGNSTAAISYKTGTAVSDPGTPGAVSGHGIATPPATSPGYTKIAEILVVNGQTIVDATSIVDRRRLAGVGGVLNFSAEWRYQWNSGTPILTLKNLVAPPGVQIGMHTPGGQRGSVEIYIVGGAFTYCAASIQAAFAGNTGVSNAEAILVPQGNTTTTNPAPTYTTSGPVISKLAASTPAIVVGGGQQAWQAELNARYINSSGVSNVTDSSLEDILFTISGCLS